MTIILTRWKSLVRIQCRPIDLRSICADALHASRHAGGGSPALVSNACATGFPRLIPIHSVPFISLPVQRGGAHAKRANSRSAWCSIPVHHQRLGPRVAGLFPARIAINRLKEE